MLSLRLSKTGLGYLLIFVMLSLFALMVTNLLTAGHPAKFSDLLFLSYVATFLFGLSLFVLSKLEQRTFSLTSILLMIAFLFNFGQLFLWALGIRTDTEIGKVTLYANFPAPNDQQIYNAALFSIYCYVAMVVGICSIRIFRLDYSCLHSFDDSRQDMLQRIIYKVSLWLSFVIVPATFYKSWLVLRQSALHGYGSLYYSDFSVNSLIGRSEDYFFPVIVGLLLGSNYRKVKLAYSLFGAYMLFYTLAGERGNWFYKLIVLIWMHSTYYKKINWIKFIKLSVPGFISLSVLSFIINIRNQGLANLSLSDLGQVMSVSENVLVRFIQEMGGSLGVTVIVLSFGQGVFSHFGNTFVSSALTSVSTALATRLGVSHVYLGNYLSQDLLKIRWGTGFTFFAETFINAGWLGFIYMFFFGMLFAELISDDKGIMQRYVATTSCVILCAMMRDSSLTGFRQLVQVVLFMVILVWLASKVAGRRHHA
ncbi:O-antigen polysaccharide polymerase Wzy [Streptococcus sp. E17BB]|uniref:O-antigen polysaccharide polymerase Wzy n=1 Tax=Streptococcus sp. E17BB TaxID=3278714 RepID=UPI00359EF393